jgi:hypothetical protein
MEQRKTLNFHKLSKPRRRSTSSRRVRKIMLTMVLAAIVICSFAAYFYKDECKDHVANLVQMVETKFGLVERQ